MQKRTKKLAMLMVVLVSVLVLAGCDVDHYSEPIHIDEIESGFTWVQTIVAWLADFLIMLSRITGGQYIVGLLLITLIVRIVGWPIYSKSTAMSANMQIAQPELERLKEKYQNKKDEASQRLYQQEMMQIYKKYDINPLGCLLPFLQMPIFIAMYQVVRRLPLAIHPDYVEEYGHTVEGIDFQFLFMNFAAEVPTRESFNLSQHWINIVLALIVGATMYFYQRYAMKRPDFLKGKNYPKTPQQLQSEKTMKFMTYFMVVMLTSIAFTNLGIAFYWIIGNLFQFVQTYVNRKKMYKKISEST